MASLPDPSMQSLLAAARRYSSDNAAHSGINSINSAHHHYHSDPVHHRQTNRINSRQELFSESRKPSVHSDLMMAEQQRRLSEAGVNRRPSAAHILTEDTSNFMIGQRVYADGVKPGRINFIGETKFGPGDWAGIFLDEPIGKNDGSVHNIKYFECEPKHGIFSRLYRLTREPIEGAEEILNQCRRFGYEIVESPTERRGSLSGGSRRGSVDRSSLSPRRGSTPEARSPRRTPEPVGRASPDTVGRRGSIGLIEARRNSLSGNERSLGIPTRKFTPGKSPLASPNNSGSKSNLYMSSKIEKDPDIERLANEARRLSLGGTAANGSGDNKISQSKSPRIGNGRRPSDNINALRQTKDRRTSGSLNGSNGGCSNHPCHNAGSKPPSSIRRPSEQGDRRGSCTGEHVTRGTGAGFDYLTSNIRGSGADLDDVGRKGSGVGVGLERRGSGVGVERKGSGVGLERRGSGALAERRGGVGGMRRPSEDLNAAELQQRRLSEAGLRRPSATDVVLNKCTEHLMVGQQVWVDGNKEGRIAYLGAVHFAKGDMAGVHLVHPIGKNNGTVGGILYFQTEPRHGIFSKLHRLALSPMGYDSSGE